MENQQSSATSKKKPPKGKGAVLKKVSPDTARLILQIKEKANKKPFGRKVRDGEVIALALTQLSDQHIKELQDATLSEKDKLHLAHEEFMKQHGKLSLDEFIGKLLRQEVRAKD